jgi:hypothetical protein
MRDASRAGETSIVALVCAAAVVGGQCEGRRAAGAGVVGGQAEDLGVHRALVATQGVAKEVEGRRAMDLVQGRFGVGVEHAAPGRLEVAVQGRWRQARQGTG